MEALGQFSGFSRCCLGKGLHTLPFVQAVSRPLGETRAGSDKRSLRLGLGFSLVWKEGHIVRA